jgi:cell division protein FtsL
VIEMLHSLATLFSAHSRQLSESELKEQEWSRLLANAASQRERDEINDFFSRSIAA